MIDKEHLKKVYHRACEIWQERAELEHIAYCEKHDMNTETELWKGLLHMIAECKAEAYDRGLDNVPGLPVLDGLKELVDQGRMSTEFYGAIHELIYKSYEDGQTARKKFLEQ